MDSFHHILLLLLSFFSVFLGCYGFGEDGTIKWGQSVPLTGSNEEYGFGMRDGLEAAFHEVNVQGGVLGGYNLTVVTLDDGYEPTRAAENAETLCGRSDIFGIAANFGSSTSKVFLPIATEHQKPFVGPFSGADFLRKPYNPYAVHFRASYADEVAGMVAFLTKRKGLTRFSCLYQNDDFGKSGFDGLLIALEKSFLSLESSGTYERNTVDVESGLSNIMSGNPEAIVLVTTYPAAVKFIKLAKEIDSALVFIAISAVSPVKLQEGLGVYTYNVYVTGISPLTTDTSFKVVGSLETALKAYNASITPNVVNLEGYIVGRLVIEGFKKMYVGKTGKLGTTEITSSGFLSSFARKVTYSIDDIALGPFGADVCDDIAQEECGCNQGGRTVYFLWFDGSSPQPIKYQFSFTSCGFRPLVPSQSTTSSSSDVMMFVFLAVAGICSFILVLGFGRVLFMLRKASNILVHHKGS